jgi:hypothetical protein
MTAQKVTRTRTRKTKQNMVDSNSAPAVSSAVNSETAAVAAETSGEVPETAANSDSAATPQENSKMNTLTYVPGTKSKSSYSFRLPGVLGSVRIAKSLFGGQAPPETIAIDAPLVAANPERAAKLAAKQERRTKMEETAAQRASRLESRIAKQQAAAAKNAAKLEKLRQRLAAKNGSVAETGSATVGAEGAAQEVTEEMAAQ